MTGVDVSTAEFGRVAVLYGGTSAEREISLKSGRAVHDALCENGVNSFLIDVSDNIIDQLRGQPIDRVFIALHGPGGEDGRIQALLEFMQLPYSGSGVQASSLAMDKWKSKQIFEASSIPTPEYRELSEDNLTSVIDELGPDLIVKPAHEGSSIGMSRVGNLEQLKAAYQMARHYDSCVFAERLITGAEYTVAILDSDALPVIKLETDHQFYDFDAKYLADDTRYLCPCGLSPEAERELQKLALLAFQSLGCSGWGRVDFMADTKGKFYALEVNTVPGMTDHSLVPMAAGAAGIGFSELALKILQSSTET